MVLNVDPAELVSVATQLANMATDTAAALPRGWVVPGGADPVSVHRVPALNKTKAELANKVTEVLQHGVHGTAANIGASAADYSTTDDAGARLVGGSGGATITNPVTAQGNYVRHVAPETATPSAEAVDPLTLAEQLHSGPGTGGATALADEVRQYLGDAHAAAHSGVSSAALTVQNWQPVGDDVAKSLTKHAHSLDQLGGGLQSLVDGIDTYSNAFATAKAAHPTPSEIIATRKELLTAMRSKNPAAVAAAMAKFQEQNARSADVLANYATTVGVDLSTTTAAGKAATTDCDKGTGGASGSGTGTSSGSGSGSGTGSSTGTATTSTSGAAAASGDSSLLSSLTSMLPELLTMGTAAAQQLAPQNSGDGAGTSDTLGGAGDSTIPDLSSYAAGPSAAFGAGAGSVGDATATAQDIALGTMPMVAAAAAMDASSLPPAAVTEPVTSAITAAEAAAARGGAGGAGGMPYMPMMPGAGGAGAGAGGDRNRVVAWHPDRLMYVDDTPHTEQVIGEKPSIAPAVTPPTPVNQVPSQGGTT